MNKKKKKEFSKQVIAWNIAITCFLILLSMTFGLCGFDTSIFAILIPSALGVLATAEAFYYNKAKIENLLKIKISFIKAKYKDDVESCEWLDEELAEINDLIKSKIDQKIEETITENINPRL